MARLAAGTLTVPTHMFIDESGDRRTGHDGDFFVFAVLATEDPDSLRGAVKKTKAKLHIRGEVKNKRLSPEEREHFLTAIGSTDIHVLPYVISKPSLTSAHFEKGGQPAYRAHLANAVRNAAMKTSMRRTTYTGPRVPLVCYPDPVIPLKKDPRPVDALLRYVVRSTPANVEITGIIKTPSSYEAGLQAADIVVGAIFYRIGKRQNFSDVLDPIRAKIEVNEWSVFPTDAYDDFARLL